MENPAAIDMITMFEAFFPEHAARWKYLLNRSVSKWHKMAPYRHWFSIDQSASMPPDIDLSHPLLNERRRLDVVALRCTQKGSWLKEMPLEEAYPSVVEGYISVIPGKLALAVNHEGGSWLLTKSSS
ncbi:hypothetical protein N8I74_09740 [Chitiniphilus purpureus]|uniref:Uncharacterized protein n=1 Tax=Chitiniphilus purpureus TaxID=2981137 RepID=A0ABY6DGX2_9NEIS|nr:hypothetical protein [Chitiniphilus sp. CD1]UXY13609.1 hypothetical protein N8I74_09740 [Chitiniphilus sp. CD1]